MKNLILVCNDLFGIEILEIINQININSVHNGREPIYNIIGYLSMNNKANPLGDSICRIKRLGNIYNWIPSTEEHFVLGICNPEDKSEAVKVLKEKGACFEAIITPWVLAPPLDVGEGSVVSAYSVKQGLKIGKYVTIIGSMLSGHKIDDYSTVLRFSNIAGDIGKCSYIGNHVFLAIGKSIGDNCIVADGSIVVKTVKSESSVSGVPARKIRK